MGAEHLQQSIKGNLRDTITHLEDGLDSVRSALKTFEALPSASTNIPMQASIAQIAAEIERTASNFDCTNPEQYPRIMRE